jgi:hypothetical protein
MGNGNIWWAPLTGLLFVAFLVASFVLLGDEPPDPTEKSIQEVIDFYVDDKDSIFVSGIAQGFAGAMLIFYGGYLFRRLRAAGGDATAALTLGGAVALAVALAIDGTINIALAESAEDIEPGAVQALAVLWQNDFVPLAMGMLVFLMSFGISIVRHGALPKWMGWVAIVTSLTAISPAFPVAGIAAVLLILVSSIIFMRGERSSEPGQPAV